MHIPDGFLSTPVWIALDVLAVPAVGLAVRKTQREFDEGRIPLLGVMGAFVFAAQMINFPVGIGTSGHLVGGALLAFVLGWPAAAVVMTAILAIQALVFQDGGILALGANVTNMAIVGVLVGYLPFHLWSGGGATARSIAIFAGGFASVLVSAVLALVQLILSGVPMPAPVAGISVGFFAVSALLEGAITLAVVQALETINPNFIRKAGRPKGGAAAIVLAMAVFLAAVGVIFASSQPDGLEKLAMNVGISQRATNLFATPLADYEAAFLQSAWLRKAAAGLAGLALVYAACLAFGRFSARKRSA